MFEDLKKRWGRLPTPMKIVLGLAATSAALTGAAVGAGAQR